MLQKWVVGASALVAIVGLGGCGGGGSSSGAGGSGNSYLFLTDAINSNYTHVWATVTKVDLVGSNGVATNIYDSSSTGGQVVDLLSLHGTSGQQYLMLGGFSTPSGAFTGANVTVSSSLSIVPSGSASAVAAKFAGAGGSTTVLTAKFASPQNIASTKKVVLDFNLANWNLNGSTVSAPNNAFVQCGPGNGVMIGPGGVVGSNYFGVVANLAGTAPTMTFSVGQGPAPINVVTSASTVLYNSDGSTNPTLANGDLVTVAGSFDTTNNVVDATAIIIQVGSLPPPPAQILGLVTADSLSGNSITVTINGCGGFQPPSTSVTVNLTSTTTYVDMSGVTDTEAQFFANLTPGTTNIQAEGTMSGTTFTATAVQIVAPMTGGGGSTGGGGGGPIGNPLIVSVAGPVSNIDTTADTFTLTLNQWTGGWQLPNILTSIVTNANTTYTVNGTAESASTFFAALTPNTFVNVRGTMATAASTVIAQTVSIVPPNAGPTKR